MVQFAYRSEYRVFAGPSGATLLFYDPMTSPASGSNYVGAGGSGAFSSAGLTVTNTTFQAFQLRAGLIPATSNLGYGLTIVAAPTGFTNTTIGQLLPGYATEGSLAWLFTSNSSAVIPAGQTFNVGVTDVAGTSVFGSASSSGVAPVYIRGAILFPRNGYLLNYMTLTNPDNVTWGSATYVPYPVGSPPIRNVNGTAGMGLTTTQPTLNLRAAAGSGNFTRVKDFYIFSYDNFSTP